ncbi:hypothetical protein [Crocosphaera sp.]|uniref:hypothetical protein n=1 Tax=Crocosphaera sp. TaxID=2729996 RepID=UPI00258D8E35|nr:hypothetical protein [Crocosphaera sp.]
MGRLGDGKCGETGRWGDWETGRLGDGETGRLGDWGDWGELSLTKKPRKIGEHITEDNGDILATILRNLYHR